MTSTPAPPGSDDVRASEVASQEVRAYEAMLDVPGADHPLATLRNEDQAVRVIDALAHPGLTRIRAQPSREVVGRAGESVGDGRYVVDKRAKFWPIISLGLTQPNRGARRAHGITNSAPTYRAETLEEA